MSADVPAGLDPLLAPFVAAEDEESARGALGVVFEAHVLPIVRGVVRRELAWGTGRGASEADRGRHRHGHRAPDRLPDAHGARTEMRCGCGARGDRWQ